MPKGTPTTFQLGQYFMHHEEHGSVHLVGKPEVQPPRALQRRVPLIVSLLLRTHGIPNAIPLLIPRDIVDLRQDKQHDTQQINRDQDTVTPVIKRLVVVPVNEVRAHITKLHGHVVERRGDTACSDVVRVFGRPPHQDGVAVGVGQKSSNEAVCGPGLDVDAGPEAQGDDTGERPERLEHADEGAFVEAL